MKPILLIIAIATLALRAAAQDAVSVTGADVTEAGIYTAHAIKTFAAPGVSSGTNEGLDSFTLVQATTNVPARIGMRFGCHASKMLRISQHCQSATRRDWR